MLKDCIINFKGNWDEHFPSVEFSYNNSFHAFIPMAPYEALYSSRCRSPIGLFEVGESLLLASDFDYKTLENVHIIRNRLRIAYTQQKYYVDHRKTNLEFEEGYKMYLKISPMKGMVRLVKKGKLSPHNGLVRFLMN